MKKTVLELDISRAVKNYYILATLHLFYFILGLVKQYLKVR